MEKIKLKNEIAVNLEKLMNIFPIIVEDITNGIKIDMQELKIHVEKLLRHVVPDGKKIRGLMVPEIYKWIEKEERLTFENIKLSYVMGWLIELAQATALLFDDIMDKTEIRRGSPCWYTKQNIGLNAVKDGLFLEEALYFILRKYFSQHPHVLSIYKLIHAAFWKSILGQAIDCMSIKGGKPNIPFFTMENYKNLAKYKTAYALYTPVAIALYLANISDQNLHKETQSLFIDIGVMYQVQDDFLDCFAVDGKFSENLGDDIRESKCTWFAVKALEMANSEQREIFEKHYGSSDPKAPEAIGKLYQDLDMPKIYAQYEMETFENILIRVEQLPTGLPVEIFSAIIKRVYKRKF